MVSDFSLTHIHMYLCLLLQRRLGDIQYYSWVSRCSQRPHPSSSVPSKIVDTIKKKTIRARLFQLFPRMPGGKMSATSTFDDCGLRFKVLVQGHRGMLWVKLCLHYSSKTIEDRTFPLNTMYLIRLLFSLVSSGLNFCYLLHVLVNIFYLLLEKL